MRWSKFNYTFKRANDEWVLYNSLSGVLLSFTKEDYDNLMILKNNQGDVFLHEDYEMLAESKIFVTDDEEERNKLTEEIVLRRKQDALLDIWIYPTLGCNFKCSYCFQLPYESHTMSEETIDNTIIFIKKEVEKTNPALININWMGGEPLLVLEKIRKINDNLKDFALSKNILVESKITTNGYLLNKTFITDDIDNLNVKCIQITIDGTEETHNKKRPLHNNQETYSKIIKNIENLFSIRNDIALHLRFNVDKNNKDEFPLVYEDLKNKFKGNNIIIYPGFVDNYSLVCKSSDEDSCNVDKNERAQFYIDLFRNHNIVIRDFFPRINLDSCSARHVNSYMIGPRGYIYKCTTAVGQDEYSIGNVNNGHDNYISNKEILNDFLYEKDFLEDDTCKECFHFPTCGGGCPLLRLKEKYFGEKHNTCSLEKGNLDEFLDTHIFIQENKNG